MSTAVEKPEFDVLVATLLYLMSRYAQTPNAELSQSIIDHLNFLECHPDCTSAVLTTAGSRLRKHWDSIQNAKAIVQGTGDQFARLNSHWKLH